MRALLFCLFLACRTQPFDERTFDLAQSSPPSDLSHPSDLAHRSDQPCSPKVPDGYCPERSTCCPYSCWGGSDANGWCSPGDGCPLC